MKVEQIITNQQKLIENDFIKWTSFLTERNILRTQEDYERKSLIKRDH